MDVVTFPISGYLTIDRVKLGFRFGENNPLPKAMINDCLKAYERAGRANRCRVQPYGDSVLPPRRSKISLPGLTRASINVETGAGKGKYPYAAFDFNLNRLLACEESKNSFRDAFCDLVPGGGYEYLVENGFVLYVEFAIDFNRAEMRDVEVFHPRTTLGNRVGEPSSPPETIYLYGSSNRIPDFCIYDKAKQLRMTTDRRVRTFRVRVEAKLKLNVNPCRSKTQVVTLHKLGNPFSNLRLYSSPALDTIFSADRHRSFLEKARRIGLQAALGGKDNADRARRLRMLEDARLSYWCPNGIWEEQHQIAIQELIDLQRTCRKNNLR